MILSVGFTGTRKGLSPAARAALKDMLGALGIQFFFHHGSCIGADSEAHDIALSLGGLIIIHPPDNPAARAFKQGAHQILEPQPYLERNKAIVNASQLLVACPESTTEQQRSGTWSTVRYARRIMREVVIITPDGILHRNAVGNTNRGE